MSFVVYISCYGKVERTEGLMSHRNALAIVAYLKYHLVAKPLYIVNVEQIKNV